MGLNYFLPLYSKNYEIAFLGPVFVNNSLRNNLEHITNVLVHPVGINDTLCRKHFIDVKGSETFVLNNENTIPVTKTDGKTSPDEVIIHTLHNKKHSQLGVINYRVEFQGKSFVFATDVEADPETGYDAELAEFARGADLLAMDGQYTAESYKHRKGWGHSTYQMACRTAEVAEVKQLAVIHHDPDHDDTTMDTIAGEAVTLFSNTVIAREMLTIEL